MKVRAALLPAIVVLAGAEPLLITRPVPLQDWSNHLARIHILAALLRGDAFWGQFYRVSGFLVPDATMDLSLLGLTRLGLSVPVAGSVFLLATYAVFVGGFGALARAFGAWGAEKPAFAVLLFYGNALFWGLASYVLAVGLLMGLLAVWLRLRRSVARLALAGAGAALLLFTHVVAAVAWVAVLGCIDLHRLLTRRPRRMLHGAPWLAALVVVAILLRAMPGGTGHDLAIRYSGAGLSGLAAHKLRLLWRVLLGGSRLQDVASLLALLLAVLAVLLGRPRIAPAAAWSAVGLFVLVLAAPERVGTGSLLDQRLAILPLLLAAAAIRLRPHAAVTWAVSLAVLLRTLVVAASFHAAGTVFADFRARAAGLPAGAVMLMANGRPVPLLTWQEVWSPPLTSLATQMVFRGLFMPHVFANPAQQPMALRRDYESLTQPWNLTDAPHLAAATAALAGLCAAHRFAGVYLTVLYPGRFIAAHAGAALLATRPDYLLLDACRLPNAAAG